MFQDIVLKLIKQSSSNLLVRLRLLIPVLEVWPQGLAKLHSPKVIKDTVAVSTKMVDDIWYYAGDRSTDISWYTKRGMLAKLYFSTQLAMLNDSSPDFKDTWDFLDRRLFKTTLYCFLLLLTMLCLFDSVEEII